MALTGSRFLGLQPPRTVASRGTRRTLEAWAPLRKPLLICAHLCKSAGKSSDAPQGTGQMASPRARRVLMTCQAAHRQLSGSGEPQWRPRWPPESIRDLQALSERSLLGPIHNLGDATQVHCTQAPEFLERKNALRLPDVDWCRNSIQILFVDGSDTVRARMAAGLLEIVSSWNHLGRMVDQDRCGLYATPKEQLPASTTVALLSQSYSLKIMPYHFVQPCQRFEVEDLHRYDLVIALDTAVEGHILAAVSREAEEQHGSSYYKYLRGKVALFSDFFGWCSDEEVGKEDPTGARSLLPPSLVDQLCPRLEEARRLPDVMRPDLQSPEGMDEWHDMNSGLLLGCACLIRYLMDSFPDNLRGLHANDL